MIPPNSVRFGGIKFGGPKKILNLTGIYFCDLHKNSNLAGIYFFWERYLEKIESKVLTSKDSNFF